MKNTVRLLPLAVLALALVVGACDSFEEINTDPNNPPDTPESLRLTGVLSNFSYQVLGGDPARTPNHWVQQLAYNGVQPSLDTYQVDESDVNNLWQFFSYTNVMYNAALLDEQATANGNYEYAAIAKTILAWNLGIVTDLWNDVPYSQAFQIEDGRIVDTTPGYDSQEEVYAAVFDLLNAALEDYGRALDPNRPNPASPASDDLVYRGDMAKWERMTNTLLARMHLHLTNAPGNSATTRAQQALAALQNGFQSNADDAVFRYFNESGAENPWYQWVIDGKWDTRNQLSEHYVTLLKTKRDPRLPIQVRQVGAVNALGEVLGFSPVPFTEGMFALDDPTYVGHTNGAEGIGTSVISSIGTYYSAANAPLTWISYAEAKFIEAEATLITQGPAAADPIYREAIRASMDKLGVSADDRDAYVDARPALNEAENPLRELILEKYVANFLSHDVFNDWRRTGYPELEPITNRPFTPSGEIPVRYPYPASELSNNPDNVGATGVPAGFGALDIPVWWDSSN